MIPGRSKKEEMWKGISSSRRGALLGEGTDRKKKVQQGHASQRAGNLDRYGTVMANKPEENEEEEYAAGNRKQMERNPVRESHGWRNENALTSDPSMLIILGGASGILTKQATTLPTEGNTTSAGTK